MGGRHSKRSVDISGNQGGAAPTADEQPLDGKLERIDEGTKIALNGATHSEPTKAENDERVPNGDPTSPSSPLKAEPEAAGPSTPPMVSPTTEINTAVAQEAGVEPEAPQPPKKKDKVKKKWSFRSISFSKKDKSKPGKEDGKEDTEGMPEAVPEAVTEVISEMIPEAVTAPETVAKVAEEKSDEATSFISSFTGAIGGAVKNVGDTVKSVGDSVSDSVSEGLVEAENMAEDKRASTQENIEKATAKVAEKAEALVVKMEALTVQAVDTVKELVGLGESEAAKAGSEVVEIAKAEVDGVQAALPEADQIVTAVQDVATSQITDSDEADVILSNIPSDLIPSGNLPIAIEVEVKSTKELSAKVDEIPPPLPASPPPSETIVKMISGVVENASTVGEVNEMAEVVAANLPTTTKPVSPATTHIPMTFSDPDVFPEFGEAGGDKIPFTPSNMPFTISVQTCQSSEELLGGEVLTQVTQVSTTTTITSVESKEEMVYVTESESATETLVGVASEEAEDPDVSTELKKPAEE